MERGHRGSQDRDKVNGPPLSGSAAADQTRPAPASTERDDRTRTLLDAQEQWGDLVATLVGMRTQIESNGWTRDQANAIVAHTFGWRAADGTAPDGPT